MSPARIIRDTELPAMLQEDTLNSLTVSSLLKRFDLVRDWNQVRYWERYSFVYCENPEEKGTKLVYSQYEFRKIWFLAYLVNKVGLSAARAYPLADKIAEATYKDTKPVIWVTYKGLTIGIPNVLTESLNGNPRN